MRKQYWSANDLLNKDAMFNFTIGGYGTGKAFDDKHRFIKKGIKKEVEGGTTGGGVLCRPTNE